MRAAAAVVLAATLALPLHASPASAQLFPTTTTTSPPSTDDPTTTTLLPTTTTPSTEAPTTTAPPPPETTAPPATEAPTTTAPPQTSSTFVPPSGQPQVEEPREGPLEAKTGLLPLFVALSLGGFGVAIVIVGAQLVATRPRARRGPATRGGASG